MKKHYILFSVKMPDESDKTKMAWWKDCEAKLQNHTTKLNTPKNEKTIEQIARGVWLFEREPSADFLCELFVSVRQCGLSYKIRFLSRES